jgi:hypothetical protein
MRGGLRWPFRPLQVTCVLVAVLLTAAFSLQSNFCDHARVSLFSNLSERMNADAIIAGGPNSTDLKIARHLPALRGAGGHFRVLPASGDAAALNVASGAPEMT